MWRLLPPQQATIACRGPRRENATWPLRFRSTRIGDHAIVRSQPKRLASASPASLSLSKEHSSIAGRLHGCSQAALRAAFPVRRPSTCSRCRASSAARDAPSSGSPARGIAPSALSTPCARRTSPFLSSHAIFAATDCPCPEIYAEDLSQGAYLEEDLGDTTLFEFLSAQSRRRRHRARGR